MKNRNIALILSMIAIIFHGSVYSQKTEDYSSWGDDAYKAGDFYGASYYYGQAYSSDSSNKDILWKIAESQRKFNNYTEAENTYSEILKYDKNNKFTYALFWLAVMNKNNRKYEESFKNFKTYFDRYGTVNDYYSKKAKYETDHYSLIIKLSNDSVPFLVENTGVSINTPYSEFGAVQLGDSSLFYSSLRSIDSVPEESFFQAIYLTKIYESKSSPMGWLKSMQWKSRVNSKENHDGNISFSSENNCLFFSRCKSGGYLPDKCAIYRSRNINGIFQKPEKLGSKINIQGYSSTQPAFFGFNCSTDGVLYFASDRPGGFGNFDIWYSIYEKGKFNEPVNLGSNINTPGDEVSPFYHADSSILYFSSDWHAGLGGFDIFSSKGSLNNWSSPHNMGQPINSSSNDLYFTVNQNDPDGYLTSNRPGSMYIKGETCCNDIFSYTRIAKPKQELPEIIVVKKDSITELRETIKLMLPLTLYFHNDEPDPRSWQTQSSRNYQETLLEYMMMREHYREEYAKGLTGEQKSRAENDIDDFFDNYVSKGFTDLQRFTGLLLFDLRGGNDINIKIKGFCSPLNTTEYNLNLAKRRISSLKNYLTGYAGGVFVKYLNGTSADGGKLTIYEDPIGKAQAASFVSDNPHDKRNSIYSRAAAFERKVQIIMYSEGKDGISPELPSLSISESTLDLGILAPGAQKSMKIFFTNSGQSELVINKIETGSAALTVLFPSEPILPEAKGVISITYYAPNTTGIYMETMTIISNAAEGKKLIEIRIKVEE